LQISPVTIELGPKINAAAVTLSNPGETPIYGQLRVFKWDQKDGEDVLTATTDIAASPPLIEIAPGSDQVVRLVRTERNAVQGEQSSRILIDEIADENASPPSSGVQIRMR